MKKLLKTILPVALLAGGSGLAGAVSFTKEAADTELILLRKDNVSDKKFLTEISNITHSSYEIKKTYVGIGNGYLINVPANSVAELKSSKYVEYLGKNHVATVETMDEAGTTPVVYDFTNYSAQQLGIPTTSKKGEGLCIAVLDSSFDVNHESWQTLDDQLTKKFTQSDIEAKVGTKGFHGNGTYLNNKIVYVHDYGGTTTYSESSGYSTPIEDNDVLADNGDSCHGAHTASLAAGNGTQFQGIAPNAQVALMKIGSDVRNEKSYIITTDAELNAFNDAFLLGVDVLSLSIGSDLNDWDTELEQVIMDKLANAGCGTFISAGNDGRATWNNSGMYSAWSTDMVETGTSGGLANLKNTVAVASSVLDRDAPDEMTFAADGQMLKMSDQVKITAGSETNPPVEKPFSSLIPTGELSVALEYVCVPGLGKSADYDGIDVTGKVAVISRGETTFVEKIATAKGNGAIGCIIHNNTGLGSLGGFALSDATEAGLIPTLAASKEVGDILRNAQLKVLTVSRDNLASYSTNCGSASLRVNPALTAPGSNILGAVYRDDNNEVDHTAYANYDGTSMACPNMAGTYAAVVSDLETNENVIQKLMSTASPVVQANGAEAAVNRQGAGIPNAEAAEQGMFLTEKVSGQAKAELFTNEDISAGKVKFTAVIHNENGATGVYDATLNVNCPTVVSLDSESYSAYVGQVFQTNTQQRIGQKTFTVNLTGDATQEVEVEYEISADAKAYLEETFENGVVLDGFFNLTSSTLVDLHIPFLGFFGDFSKQDCVEDFDFEKKNDGKLYQSEILNHLCSETGINLPNANFESTVVYAKGGLEDVTMSNILTNSVNIKEEYNPVTTKEIDGTYHIYAGATGVADTLLFQQFVNRSVVTNDITMTDSKGNVVLEDHMFDSLYGTEGEYALWKSLATISLFASASKFVAHRAYTIIPLADYPNGSYNFHMSYTLACGAVQTRDYVLEINHSVEAPNFEVTYSGTVASLKFDAEMALVKLGDTVIEPTVEGTTTTYKVDLSTVTLKDNVQIYAQGTNYSVLKGLIGKDGKGILFNSEIQNKYIVSFSESVSGSTVNLSYTLSNSKKIIVKPESSSTVCFLTSKLNGKQVESVVNAKGETCQFVQADGLFTIIGTGQKFTVTLAGGQDESTPDSSTPVESSEPASSEVPGGTSGCGGSINSSLFIVTAICILACLSLYYYKKRA